MMRVLLTGFEPFGRSRVNPSQEVVRWFARHRSNLPGAEPVELVCEVLPVEHTRGPAMLLEAIRAHNPRMVISLGEARGRAALSIERVAVNLLDYRMPDNAGVVMADEPIAPDGPDAYFSTLPVRAMAEAVRSAGVAAELSQDAGTCLCNEVMYAALHESRERLNGEARAGFIHLPWLPEQVAAQQEAGEAARPVPSMSLDLMTRGVSAAITAAVRSFDVEHLSV